LRYFIVLSLFIYLSLGGPDCGEETFKYGLNDKDIKQVLSLSNAVRQKVMAGTVPGQPKGCGLETLTYDAGLANGARVVTEQCKMQHKLKDDSRYPDGVGQNLYIYSSTVFTKGINWTAVIDSWYAEYKDLDWPFTNTGSKQVGHYTQLVTGNTSKVGCDCVHWKENNFIKVLVACNYGPAGNFDGVEHYKTC